MTIGNRRIRQWRRVAAIALVAVCSPLWLGVGPVMSATFVPARHEAALRTLVARQTVPGQVTFFRFYPAPVDPTWVYYEVGLHITGTPTKQVDEAQGFAHWITNHWRLILGPGSGFCYIRGELGPIPKRIQVSLHHVCPAG